ncbi:MULTISPECIES: VanZ family protein [Erysipelothrix]|uniref:VanZ family protein n=1 Tax=Erysipelothrix TaxID=1647 RepID=UPI00190A8715|nr:MULTISPECIES: VanZ family protein [unclassified Erysipelothrix]MBK2402444.1 VanZ family protein [Erysipelothrix sp. strain 2 (EsS2-6-Brazil)]MBK2403332.1 VanZ family protein [Erysipelothrix sp. strain 2 (EsS2-7-Brazil)]
MFERYLGPIIKNTQGVSINSGIIVYILIAMFFLVKYRKTTIKNKILGLLFILYLGKVLDLTLFPLPLNQKEIQNAAIHFSLENASIDYYNLMPFRSGLSLKNLKEPLLNVLMMVPMGVFLPVFFKRLRNIKYTVFVTFFISLLIECLELLLTLAFGVILWHFDVTDLITNTLGGLLGFCLYYGVIRHLLNYVDQKEGHWLQRKGFNVLSVVLLVLFMMSSIYLEVSANDVITYRLNMRNMISNGKANRKYYTFEHNTVSMEGYMKLKRDDFEGFHSDNPTIELKQKVLFLDYSYGKYEVGPMHLNAHQDEGDDRFFTMGWTVDHPGNHFYFITESKIATARKVGEAHITNP